MTTAIGAACFIVNKPRSSTRRPYFDPPEEPNKRLPLRAIPLESLSWHAWSLGQPLVERDSWPLTGIEKPIETMTLEELESTQRMDPISESRRSWLASGVGAYSADLRQEYEDGELGSFADSVPDDSTLWDFSDVDDRLDLGLDEDLIEHDAHRYGVPYVFPAHAPSPVAAKQIEWEQCQAQNGPVHHLRPIPNTEGLLRFQTVLTPKTRLFPDNDSLLRVASWLKRQITNDVGPVATYAELQERLDLLRDQLDTAGAMTPERIKLRLKNMDLRIRRERNQLNAELEELWHSSYIHPLRAVAIIGDREVNVTVEHAHPRNTKPLTADSTYHHAWRPADGSTTELGFDLMSDIALEQTLGVRDPDELDSETPALESRRDARLWSETGYVLNH